MKIRRKQLLSISFHARLRKRRCTRRWPSASKFESERYYFSMIRLPMRAWLVFFLFLLSAIAFLDRTNISIAGPQISREFSLGNVRLGWVMSAFLVGYASSQVLAGWIAVRLGARRA